MAGDERIIEEIRKALAKASATVSSLDPWQEHFGRETTAQAVKSVQAADIIQGFSGNWAASYAFDWGAGISARTALDSQQDISVPTPLREKLLKAGQPGFSDVDFVPYNWGTNRFATKGPSLVGHPISFEVVGPTLKSPYCDWTWEVEKGAGPNGGDRLRMDIRSDGSPSTSPTLLAAYQIPNNYEIGDLSSDDLNGGFYVIISSDGSNPGSIPSGTTPMDALPGHVDTARFELFRVASTGIDQQGFVELHPNKTLSDYFDLPPATVRHIRAITILRPKVTRLVAIPGSGPEPGREQTFVVVPPTTAASPDNYPPYDGGTPGDGTWIQGGFDEAGTGLSGAVSAYGGRNNLPVPLAIRQGAGRVEKNPGAPTTEIGHFIIENVTNGSTSDVGKIMKIYHVDSDDGDVLDFGTVPSLLGWFHIVAVDVLGTTYTLQRVAEVDPENGRPFFGPGPYHMEPGTPDINVYFTIHENVESLFTSESFDIDKVQAARLDCLISPRDVERTTKQVSDPSSQTLPFGSSPAMGDRAIFNTRTSPGAPIPEADDPGSLLDLGFRMVLFPAKYVGGNPFPDWDNSIHSQEVTLDPSITDEKQFWTADYSGGTVRLSHAPVATGGDLTPNGTTTGTQNPRGEIVLYAACVPYSRENCQKGSALRFVNRDEEDVDQFSSRIFSQIDGANTPALLGVPPYFDDEIALSAELDLPQTGYFDVVEGTTPFRNSLGTWGYQSTRVQDFGGGDVTVLEGVYSDPNVSAPPDPSVEDLTVVIRRETFFGQESADNSSSVDDLRFDTTYGSSYRACTVRFVGSTSSVEPDGTLTIDARGNTIEVQDEGISVLDDPEFINFIGSDIVATLNGTGVNVTVTPTPATFPETQDEGIQVQASSPFLNFVGGGVEATVNGPGTDITVPGVDTQEEGVGVQTATSFINFLGDNVTAVVNGTGTDVTIVNPQIQDAGSPVQSDTEFINFIGLGVEALASAGGASVNIPGLQMFDDDDTFGGGLVSMNPLGSVPNRINFFGNAVVGDPSGSTVDLHVNTGWQFLDSRVVSGASTTNIVLAGGPPNFLDGDNDGIYCIMGKAIFNGSINEIHIFPNGVDLTVVTGGPNTDARTKILDLETTVPTSTGLVDGLQMAGSVSDPDAAAYTFWFVYYFNPKRAEGGATGIAANRRNGVGTYMSSVTGSTVASSTPSLFRSAGMVYGSWDEPTPSNISFIEIDAGGGNPFLQGSAFYLYRAIGASPWPVGELP